MNISSRGKPKISAVFLLNSLVASTRLFSTMDKYVALQPNKKANSYCFNPASHLFTSLSTLGYLTLADISDVKLLHDMGYKNFMLSDNVSHRCFDDAMRVWQDFLKVRNG